MSVATNKKVHSFIKNTKAESEAVAEQEKKNEKIKGEHYSKVNEWFDISSICVNTLFAMTLTIGPWFKIYENTPFPDSSCILAKGTIINPGLSGLCNYKSFAAIPGEGGKWGFLMDVTYFYLAVNLIMAFLVVFSILKKKKHYTKNDNSQTISFAVNFVMFILVLIILIQFGVLTKPTKDDGIIIMLMAVNCVLTFSRLVFLGIKMYETHKHGKETGNKIGVFGTGTDVYEGPVQVHYFN